MAKSMMLTTNRCANQHALLLPGERKSKDMLALSPVSKRIPESVNGDRLSLGVNPHLRDCHLLGYLRGRADGKRIPLMAGRILDHGL